MRILLVTLAATTLAHAETTNAFVAPIRVAPIAQWQEVRRIFAACPVEPDSPLGNRRRRILNLSNADDALAAAREFQTLYAEAVRFRRDPKP